jgi:hypothetical protein
MLMSLKEIAAFFFSSTGTESLSVLASLASRFRCTERRDPSKPCIASTLPPIVDDHETIFPFVLHERLRSYLIATRSFIVVYNAG